MTRGEGCVRKRRGLGDDFLLIDCFEGKQANCKETLQPWAFPLAWLSFIVNWFGFYVFGCLVATEVYNYHVNTRPAMALGTEEMEIVEKKVKSHFSLFLFDRATK